MNTIEQCEIVGLWGHRRAVLRLDKTVNFLIGPNGCGKTTLVNLIVAALTADLRSMLQVSFSNIKITLRAIKGSTKPVIEVEKTVDETRGSTAITYKIRRRSTEKAAVFTLEDIDELRRYSVVGRRRRYLPARVSGTDSIRERLSELFNLSWLSIHRAKSFRRLEDEDSYDSSVDSKLADLSNEFVRFFSSLSQRASQELTKFQESVFLSLLMEQREPALLSSLKRTDLEGEKRALIEIYNELHVNPSRFQEMVDAHFSRLEKAYHDEDKQRITAEEFVTLITNMRVHHVVRQWNKLRKKQSAIYEPQETFLTVINNLVRGKVFSTNAKNELVASLPDESLIPLQRLSSGEKQMVIILGEALLQQRSPSIYIADEPELSLHVEWQRSLIDNILNINPAAQILFATHSPDIVSQYSDRVIDVDRILS